VNVAVPGTGGATVPLGVAITRFAGRRVAQPRSMVLDVAVDIDVGAMLDARGDPVDPEDPATAVWIDAAAIEPGSAADSDGSAAGDTFDDQKASVLLSATVDTAWLTAVMARVAPSIGMSFAISGGAGEDAATARVLETDPLLCEAGEAVLLPFAAAVNVSGHTGVWRAALRAEATPTAVRLVSVPGPEPPLWDTDIEIEDTGSSAAAARDAAVAELVKKWDTGMPLFELPLRAAGLALDTAALQSYRVAITCERGLLLASLLG
jgi:hypothetical protein